MQLGVIFPQTEIGADPKAVRDFAQAAEEDWGTLGATHLSVNTMDAGLRTPDAHITAIKHFYATIRG